MDSGIVGVGQAAANIMRGQERLEDRDASLRKGRATTDAINAVGDLAAENAELRLHLATLIRLLISKMVISPEEFQELCAGIDGMDGVMDGRFDGRIMSDGSVVVDEKAQDDLALRELSAIVKKKASE